MSMKFHSPVLPGSPFAVTNVSGVAGPGVSVDEWGRALEFLDVSMAGGRMLRVPGIVSVDGLDTYEQADGDVFVDARDVLSGGTFLAQNEDGDTAQLTVAPSLQPRGQPQGLQYHLPTNAQDRYIVEPGKNHRTVYFSKSPAAMTRAMIAADAGVSESTVNLTWLLANTQYGGSEDMPVSISMLSTFTALHNVQNYGKRSDWFLFERGYDYPEIPATMWMCGEDELHPLVYGTWGAGPRPVASFLVWTKQAPRYFLVAGFKASNVFPQKGNTIIMEDMEITGDKEMIVRTNFFTLNDSMVYEVFLQVPKNNGDLWRPSQDRISGLFFSGGDSAYFRNSLFDKNGWEEGYNVTNSFVNAQTSPMPMSYFNHNIYGSFSNMDPLFELCVTARGASQGVQTRAGGVVDRCFFWENNVALGLQSANDIGPTGGFGYVRDSVALGAGYKRVSEYQGGVNKGLGLNCWGSMKGTIVAHKANPADQEEFDARFLAYGDQGAPVGEMERHFANDTIVYKWTLKSKTTEWENMNVPAIAEATLDQVTFQKWGQDFLSLASEPSGSDILLDLRTRTNIGAITRDIIQFAKTGFGVPSPTRTTAANVVARPDTDQEGFWWSNRYNWIGGIVPGADPGDTFDLVGNFYRFNHRTDTVAGGLFNGGRIDFVGGRLTITGPLSDAANISIQRAGQIYLNSSAFPLTVGAVAGRMKVTGVLADLRGHFTGKSQTLLGTTATVKAGETLRLSGQQVEFGWADAGSGELIVEGTLALRAGVTLAVTDNYYKTPEANSGTVARSANGNPLATITDMWDTRTDKEAALQLCDVTGALPASVGEQIVVATGWSVDKTYARYEDKTVNFASIVSRGLPFPKVFRSGINGMSAPTATGTVRLRGNVVIEDAHLLAAGQTYQSGAGVTFVDEGATFDAGVSIVGGALRVAVS
ncbi:MAG: hypothetical protein MEQ74_00985 [Paracoccus sp.]|nr:hypothetical protein [Paracoccus sp. (in: a-proteobacteria)]